MATTDFWHNDECTRTSHPQSPHPGNSPCGANRWLELHSSFAFLKVRMRLALRRTMKAVEPGVLDRATHAEFPPTHWSRILQAGACVAQGDSPELEEFCRAYWPPLYAFLRR